MTDATNDESRVAEIRAELPEVIDTWGLRDKVLIGEQAEIAGLVDHVEFVLDQRDRYKAAVDAVLGLHVPWRPTHPKNIAYSDLCSTCRGEHGAYRSWPCPTVKAINDALGGTS